MMDSLHPLTPTVLLEVVVDTAAGLRIAAENGADRIELCGALSIGGVTPSTGLMKLAAELNCPVRAMIRPRGGDFCYDADELAVMHDDIYAAARCGLEGVVIGANHADGSLDQTALAGLVAHAKAHGLRVAIHRAFDLAPDALKALDICVALKIDTILTSGGAKAAADSLAGLGALVKAARGRIEILAGGGVTADNANAILASGVISLHASCRRVPIARDDRATALGYSSEMHTDAQLVAALRATLSSCLAEARS